MGQMGARPPTLADDVPCDSCLSWTKAAKSCLTCLSTFCEGHLRPHFEGEAFRDHQLSDPVKHLDKRRCKVHSKLLEFFCKTDQMCICGLCILHTHRDHKVITTEEETKEKKNLLQEERIRRQSQIEDINAAILKLKDNALAIKETTCQVRSDIDKNFGDLINCVKESQSIVTNIIESEEAVALAQTDSIQNWLHQRYSGLKRKTDEIDLLLKSDSIQLLKEFQTLEEMETDLVLPTLDTDIDKQLSNLRCIIAELTKDMMEKLLEAYREKLPAIKENGSWTNSNFPKLPQYSQLVASQQMVAFQSMPAAGPSHAPQPLLPHDFWPTSSLTGMDMGGRCIIAPSRTLVPPSMPAPTQVRRQPSSAAGTEQEPLTAAMLSGLPFQEQKQRLGERLFKLIHVLQPYLAGKITGMLLELDNLELLHCLECSDSLHSRVDDAVLALQRYQAQRDFLLKTSKRKK